MNKLFCCIFIGFLNQTLFAQQNLVLNPSFEDTVGCPIANNEVYLSKNWSSIDTIWTRDTTWAAYASPSTGWMPDFRNACDGIGEGGCPDNPFFYQYSRTGTGMMQMALYTDVHVSGGYCAPGFSINALQGRLSQTLTAGKSYCVTFYANLENTSEYAINKIGAYLDDGSIDSMGLKRSTPLNMFTPQIVDTNLITDTMNWVKIQGSFIADGTEKFITISMFADTNNLHVVRYDTLACYALYLIDDVSVIPSDSSANAGRDTTVLSPGDTAFIGVPNGAGMPCYWYKKGGTSPIDSGGSTLVHPDTTTSYVVMMDLCGHITYDTVTVWVGKVGVANLPPRSFDNLTIYPNPAGGSLTVEGAKGCNIGLYNMVGEPVYQGFMDNDKGVLDIEWLLPGVYFVRVVDPLTGYSVVRKVLKE